MLNFAQQQELGLTQTGLYVTAVRRSDIPVEVGDVVLAVAGKTFSSVSEALTIINAVPQDAVQVRLHRNGASTEATVRLK